MLGTNVLSLQSIPWEYKTKFCSSLSDLEIWPNIKNAFQSSFWGEHENAWLPKIGIYGKQGVGF